MKVWCVSLSCFLMMATAACKDRKFHSGSNPESVSIPATSVKDQRNTGFCASYTTVAFLESLYQKRTGKTIHLSEPFVGYHVMVERMLGAVRRIQALPEEKRQQAYDDLAKSLKNADSYTAMQGAWPIAIQDGKPKPDTVFEVIKKYGVVTDDAFRREFDDERKAQAAMLEIHQKFLALYDRPDKVITDRELIERVLPGGLGFLKPPPRLFRLPDSVLTSTPVEFFRSLGIDLDDFAVLNASSAEDFDSMIQATKEALAEGIPVPITASVDWVRWQQRDADRNWVAVFNGPFWENLTLAFGHAMLVTDFVNRGGKAGAMPADQLRIEVEKHPRLLDFLVVKNSWGTLELPASPEDEPGFYRLSKDFLLANTFSQSAYLTVVVPKAIAERHSRH